MHKQTNQIAHTIVVI